MIVDFKRAFSDLFSFSYPSHAYNYRTIPFCVTHINITLRLTTKLKMLESLVYECKYILNRLPSKRRCKTMRAEIAVLVLVLIQCQANVWMFLLFVVRTVFRIVLCTSRPMYRTCQNSPCGCAPSRSTHAVTLVKNTCLLQTDGERAGLSLVVPALVLCVLVVVFGVCVCNLYAICVHALACEDATDDMSGISG